MEKIIPRQSLASSLCIFSILYWLVFNHSYYFLPKLAWPIQQFWLGIGHPWLLHSDSRAQLVSILFIAFISLTFSKLLAPSLIINKLHTAPLVLIAGQLFIYGTAKLFILQFAHTGAVTGASTQFWFSVSAFPLLQQVIGISQICLGIALLIPRFCHYALVISTVMFASITVIDLYFEISVVVHSFVLFLCSFIALLFTQKSKVTYGFALAYKIFVVCAIVVECIAMSTSV